MAQMPQFSPIAAPAEPGAVPLYANVGSASTENWSRGGDTVAVRNVTRPTITPFLPAPGKATGAAVVVAPGGAFMLLAMGHEGWNVGQWLADHGIAAFVLKYRLLPTAPADKDGFPEMGARLAAALKDPAAPPSINNPLATQDALAALAHVRGNAAKYGVDPARVGMIGFSAGAMTSMNAALAADPAARPAFFGYIYGPQTPVTVPDKAPPMFAAIAWDDSLFPNRSFAVETAWRASGAKVELHAYQTGDHGFGMGKAGTTTTGVMDQFLLWLTSNGWLKH
ncbi:alpha/beta hydrolase fold domain-containing protein [Novosphingobium sp. FSY-8]|uniref:Alpha/beta hydrolase fold domain-containing protein n=2 Tax=Novosphingobium ovatum TaxID=1908523 RepID=A0ABW9XDA4_9SPHN|nr:alpha/beta hydrolase fold domain-containing protein [Novosphingobium ovatum]